MSSVVEYGHHLATIIVVVVRLAPVWLLSVLMTLALDSLPVLDPLVKSFVVGALIAFDVGASLLFLPLVALVEVGFLTRTLRLVTAKETAEDQITLLLLGNCLRVVLSDLRVQQLHELSIRGARAKQVALLLECTLKHLLEVHRV